MSRDAKKINRNIFTKLNFFSGKIDSLVFGHNSQKEGLFMDDQNNYLISEERTTDFGANIYRLKSD